MTLDGNVQVLPTVAFAQTAARRLKQSDICFVGTISACTSTLFFRLPLPRLGSHDYKEFINNKRWLMRQRLRVSN